MRIRPFVSTDKARVLNHSRESNPRTVAFIGAGIIAEAHWNGLQALNRHLAREELRLTHIVDRDLTRAESWGAENCGSSSYLPAICNDYRELLEPGNRPDIACVLLPHHLHLEVTRPLLESGIAVQLQKPIGLGITDGRKLCELGEKYPLVISEPSVLGRKAQAELARIRSGQPLGRPRLLIDQAVIDLRGGFFATPWRHLKAFAGAGWFVDHGVHRTHWMLEAFGPCKSVFARTVQIESFREDPRWGKLEVDVEDCAAATLQFESETIVQFTVMSGGRGRNHSHVELWGDNGSLREGMFQRTGHDKEEPFLPTVDNDWGHIPADPFAASFLEILDRMRDIRHDIVGSPQRALHAQAIIYACLESALTDQMVRIEDILNRTRCDYEATVWEALRRENTRDFGSLT